METMQHQDILSEIELVHAWKGATGDKKNYDDLKRGSYLTAELFSDQGASAKLELHPDFLNNRHRVVIEDFSAFEGDDDYQDGLRMVAEKIQYLRDSGLNFTIEGQPGFSDGEKIKVGVEALLAVDEKNRESEKVAA